MTSLLVGRRVAKYLEYKDRKLWRFTTETPCFIPFASTGIRLKMSSIDAVVHPFFTISEDGVKAEAEYSWDGATGALWQSKNLRVASLVHDMGCQAINAGLLPRSVRPAFDYEYRQQVLKYGMSPMRAELHYAVISLWGLIPKREGIPDYTKIEVIEIL